MKIARFEFSLFGINTYIVIDEETKDCAIIDPGMINPEERNAMLNFINSNGLKVVDIINTHLHIDHAIGNSWAQQTFSAPSSANALDLPLGERIQQQAQMFGLPFAPEEISIDRKLKDGDIINIGNGSLKVIHVPGHSQGSIALYDEADGYLISGDALFSMSIGRTDLPGGNHQQLIKSIKEKLLTLPAETVVYPGHGGPTTIGKERHSNPYLIV
ncbi:MAG: MBL fold metallo-hydrolase [Muribaculaceae bacterium]|nr:MBL fold metallo-hydrolase [Muribaculaceae bacterium]